MSGAFKVAFATALVLALPTVVEVAVRDLVEQAENTPRLPPRYSMGNVGINTPRGPIYFGGLGSSYHVPSYIFFSQGKFPEVLAAFQYPRSLGRPADQDFAYIPGR